MLLASSSSTILLKFMTAVSSSSSSSTSVGGTQKRNFRTAARKGVNNLHTNSADPLNSAVNNDYSTPFEVPIVEIDHDSNPLKSSAHKDEFRITFANCDGLNTDQKAARLREISRNDHMLLLNETNYEEKDASLLIANGLGKICAVRALDDVTFKNGNRIKPTKKVKMSNGEFKLVECRKKSGFGSAIVSKLDNVVIKVTKKKEEVLWATMDLNGTKGMVLTGYRSPSSKNDSDIRNFYDTCDKVIEDNKVGMDFIIDAMDDNAYEKSSCAASRKAAALHKIMADRHSMVDMLNGEPTRGDKQPDSCYAYFNPEKLQISVNLLGYICGDHQMMQIVVKKDNIVPMAPKYKKMSRRKLVVTEEETGRIINSKMSAWFDKWEPKVNASMSDQLMNKMSNCFMNELMEAYSKCYKKTTVCVPVDTRKNDSKFNNEIVKIRANLGGLCEKLRKNESVSLRKKICDEKEKLGKLITKAVQQNFEVQMENDLELERKNGSAFWKYTGQFVNKNSYQTRVDSALSKEKAMKKVNDIEATFINDDPGFMVDFNKWKSVTPPPKIFSMDYSVDVVREIIKDIKKVHSFYSDAYNELAKPASLLLKMIYLNQFFPKNLRESACQFIGQPPKDRAIFSMDFVPKLVEIVVKNAFDMIKVEDGTFQMAYTPKRGCVATNAKTLMEVELCGEQVIQTQQDMVKAFNYVPRDVVCEEAERLFGAGKLFESWFTDQTFTYESGGLKERRGQNSNRGVMAGRIMGVEGFMLFIATCTKLTGKNLELLWASLYADDTGPLCKFSNLVKLQEAFVWVEQWAKKMGVKFHLSGDKKPVYLAYLKKGQKFPVKELKELKLCDVPVVRVDQQKILGLLVKVRPCSCKVPKSCKLLKKCVCEFPEGDNYGNCINKYGYELNWELSKIKSLAGRIQRLRDKVSPEHLKQIVEYYFCGYLRFSASLIWHRSDKAHRNEVRFYYSMAMAACLGLTALEATNLNCCKRRSVTEENSYYVKLLAETGLPSLYEMACHDSVSVTKQLFGIAPEWYILNKSHYRLAKKGIGEVDKILSVSKECKGKLVDSLFSAAKAYFSLFYDGREAIKRRKQEILRDFKERAGGEAGIDGVVIEMGPAVTRLRKRECNEKRRMVGTPYLERYYEIKKQCTVHKVRPDGTITSKLNYRHCFATFMLSSRLEFDCLDTVDRVNNFKTPIRVGPDESSQSEPLHGTPSRRGTKRKRNDFGQDLRMDVWDEDVPSCNFCKKDLDLEIKKGKRYSHLLFECTGVVNSQPLKRANIRGKPKGLFKRLAELAVPPDPGEI